MSQSSIINCTNYIVKPHDTNVMPCTYLRIKCCTATSAPHHGIDVGAVGVVGPDAHYREAKGRREGVPDCVPLVGGNLLWQVSGKRVVGYSRHAAVIAR